MTLERFVPRKKLLKPYPTLETYRGVPMTKTKGWGCPYYISPKYYVDFKTDQDFEGSAMCELSGKYCLLEFDGDCETYNEEFREEEEVEFE